VGKVLQECRVCGDHSPNGDPNHVNRGFGGNPDQGVSLLDHLPMGSGNGVGEHVTVEHADGSDKRREGGFVVAGIDEVIDGSQAVLRPW